MRWRNCYCCCCCCAADAIRVLIEIASEQTVTMEAFMDGESVCVVTKVRV